MSDKHLIVVFDGVCILCNGAVDFIIKRDPQKKIRFIAAQSPDISKYVTDADCLDKIRKNETIVLLEEGKCHFKSDAALKILAALDSPWRILKFFRFIPKSVRDFIYNFIAKRRYRWLGRLDQCSIPDPAQRDRFLL